MWFFSEGQVMDAHRQQEMMEKLVAEAKRRIHPNPQKVLLLPPDITRYHCGAGKLTNILYHLLQKQCRIDVIPTLGQHLPHTPEENQWMFGDIPEECIIKHDWKTSCDVLGEIDRKYVKLASNGQADWPIPVEINRQVISGDYDWVINLGQVVPHEVLGFSNHNKNYFIGLSGKDMIPAAHMMAACYGIEDNLGQIVSPLRACFNIAQQQYLSKTPDIFVQIVPTLAPDGEVRITGLYIGNDVQTYVEAARYARKNNVHVLKKPVRKVVCFLDEREYKSTWVANKAVYRTRKAIADGGELIIIAPGVERFGEQPEVDRMIRKYGYTGTPKVLEAYRQDAELRKLGHAAAHLIHGSSEGRFSITYAPRNLTKAEIESVGYRYLDLAAAVQKYPADKLQEGYNSVNGEEIYYIGSPTVGLWTAKDKYIASLEKNRDFAARMMEHDADEPLWPRLKQWNEQDIADYWKL